ncbi:MAG: hypothetical protein GQ574_26450 [Crocinitomix sp.]|nr:hypothetical protein [Crocinitomix sp.]
MTNDKSIFIGKWVWYETSHNYGWCDGDAFTETINPTEGEAKLSMEFFEKGIVKFYEGGKLLNKDRLIFKIFDGEFCDGNPDYLNFFIDLNGDSENPSSDFDGCISSDTLFLIRGFPYEIYEKGCEQYISFFAKQ